MSGLGRRVTALERSAPAKPWQGEPLARRLAEMAERIQSSPSRLLPEQQSPAERTVRTALAAAEGAETGDQYCRRFWRAVGDELRVWGGRQGLWGT